MLDWLRRLLGPIKGTDAPLSAASTLVAEEVPVAIPLPEKRLTPVLRVTEDLSALSTEDLIAEESFALYNERESATHTLSAKWGKRAAEIGAELDRRSVEAQG